MYQVSGNQNPSPVEKLIEVLQREEYLNGNNRVGRVLTIIDAAFQDKEQREAVKSLMKQTLYDERSEVFEIINQFAKKYGKHDLEPTDGYIDKINQNQYPIADYFSK